jgi:hypothetical protein
LGTGTHLHIIPCDNKGRDPEMGVMLLEAKESQIASKPPTVR